MCIRAASTLASSSSCRSGLCCQDEHCCLRTGQVLLLSERSLVSGPWGSQFSGLKVSSKYNGRRQRDQMAESANTALPSVSKSINISHCLARGCSCRHQVYPVHLQSSWSRCINVLTDEWANLSTSGLGCRSAPVSWLVRSPGPEGVF